MRVTLFTRYIGKIRLYEKIVEDAPISEEKCAFVIKQILNALSYSHAQGKIHGSLRPKNICVDVNDCDDWFIKLKEYGFSKMIVDIKSKRSYGNPLFVPPERLAGSLPTDKTDIWAVGIMLFMMLTGKLPFLTKNQDALKKEIMSCDPKIESFDQYSSFLSPKCIEFLALTLCRDPESRGSAKHLLSHPWIKEKSPDLVLESKEISEILTSINSYNPKHVFEQAVYTFIAVNSASAEEEKKLNEMFFAMDVSKDGMIQKSEFIEGIKLMKGKLNYTEEELTNMFDQVDTDKSGSIDYTEFIKAAMSKKKIGTDKNLRAAFDFFDKDRSGSISKKELRDVFCSGSKKADEQLINELLSGIDENGDDEVCNLPDKL